MGESALYVAARNDHSEVVEVLLKHGALVDAANKHGYTALHEAARFGLSNTVKVLLDHGAYVDFETKEDELSPLYLAALKGHPLAVIRLIERKADVNFRASILEWGLTLTLFCKTPEGVVQRIEVW
ncbi:unnamed protein product [Caenorhabditis auriculariae]|uniref:Uncharacterized protein n=1 Tax=Caenorhabditis auriculariae TaxID=2777116 RepID=A0A8S1HWK4_9PELO|nr:unnamed protein product [Caenorhabditis auriculariae]